MPYGQSRYHVYRGELDLAPRLDEELLRLGRQRNDSAGLVLGHTTHGFKPVACRQVCVIPVASGRLDCSLRFDSPPLAYPSGRNSPTRISATGFGNCPFLSRLSGPGLGTEQRIDR